MRVTAPADLPFFSEVEVVDLSGVSGDQIRDCLSGAREAKRVRITGETATQIGDLFRRLPRGEPIRCHIPPYGLVFFSGKREVWSVSICWKCNTIQGWAGELAIGFPFDASDAVARELFRVCRQAMKGRI